MTNFLAIHGTSLSPRGCLIVAAICGAVCAYFLVGAWVPRVRARWGRHGPGSPMSAVGSIAWALVAGAWAVTTLAAGLKYEPIRSRTGWILGIAFVILIVAAFGDWIYFRNARKAG